MKDNKPHIMSPLSKKIPTYNLFAFDVETVGKNNDFLMGSIVSKDNKAIFWDKEEMSQFLISSKCFRDHARILATNLYFDLMALFQKTEHLKRFFFTFRGTRMLQAKISTRRHKRIFLDTLNYYPFSVKHMGEIIGLPKLDTPPYIKERRMPMKDEYAYIEQYNLRDSEITYGFSSFLQESFNNMGCNMRMTAASTAMDLYRRKYLTENVFQESKERITDEYKAYYGGRVEVFKRGNVKNAYYYDFNSLYPSVMLNEYPDISSSRCKLQGDMDIIEKYHGLSEVRVRCPEDIGMPFLPSRQDTKLVFPTGIFSGWYSHIELRKALKLGYDIYNIGKQIYYTRSNFPFKEYVKDLYEIRKGKKEINDKSELVIKLLMNSLYGKFGQKMRGHQEIYHMDSLTIAEIDKLHKRGKIMSSGDFMYFESDEICSIPSHIMPTLAVYTSAYGRMKLYDAMKGIDPIYCDTDSIVTTEKLHTSKELGDLKIEHEIDEGIFIRPKMYAFKTKDGKSIVRVKGNNISWSWDYDRFKKFIEDPKINIETFSTFKMSNAKGIPYNTIISSDKEFGLEDDKRSWLKQFDPMELQASYPLKV